MDLLTVNIVFENHPTKSFYFYQQNTIQQAKETIISAHTDLPNDVNNYSLFQPLQSSNPTSQLEGKFLEEQKTFAAYRLYGTISLHFILKIKQGCNNKKQSKIFQYVQEKKIEKLKETLMDNDPNCVDEKGLTPLQQAVLLNDRLIMQTLVENGAFLDYRGKEMKTPLHTAVANDKYTAVHFLVMLGHILDPKDDKGYTPLYYAVTGGFANLCRYLLQSGSREIELPDQTGRTLLMHAINKGSPSMVSDLLQHGANVKAVLDTGVSCLHLSITGGVDEISRILLQNGVDKLAKNKQGQIASHVAMILGNSTMYKLLESYDGGELHATAHPFGVYPLDMPSENQSATVKKGRIGTLKMKPTGSQSFDANSLKRNSNQSPNASNYSVANASNDVHFKLI
eukprot:NODE_11_length_54881_cov_1.430718.p16 type:complete len:397 gc:universal NODE_11_length_54881_cov_1.430718:9526-8336(-)